ncbi:MAG: hypothetical protein EAZ44_00170 [Cytophagia bacterium]|nr:MAG: hypothetical protein EAZ44_00170 [Cytophagia bacterium]TAG44646.1 MAG: hypothetical protein EAZ31_01935 [Cytophagia bacterium]TAH30695.1 MAG: hypothetical protein EAZ06_02395 [Cytophagales bacterium]
MKIKFLFLMLMFLSASKFIKAQPKNTMYGIAHLSILPLRTEPSNKSELCTQILFGEIYKVIQNSTDGQWIYIENNFDGYKGWLNKGQFKEISQKEFEEIENQKIEILCQNYTQLLIGIEKTKSIHITLGAKINSTKDNICANKDNIYIYENSIEKNNTSLTIQQKILEDAYLFLNSPYLWGGKTPFGVDCSGFTQQIMRLNQIKIKRDAYQQAEQGEKITQLNNTKTGDLAFFVRNNKVVHVGLIIEEKDLNKNKPHNYSLQKNERWIMHALECVRIDKLDEKGIFNIDNKEYSHFLHSLKRYIF